MSNILREQGLKPHLVKSFQFSTDPDFEKKLEDVVGLYLNPPENSIVLCVDEKSQIQALERSQPILPLLPGGYPNAKLTTTIAMERQCFSLH